MSIKPDTIAFVLCHSTDICPDGRLLRPPPDSQQRRGHPQCNSICSCGCSLPVSVHRQTDCQLPPASVDQWEISGCTASPTRWQSDSRGDNQHKSREHSPVCCCWRCPVFLRHMSFISHVSHLNNFRQLFIFEGQLIDVSNNIVDLIRVVFVCYFTFKRL